MSVKYHVIVAGNTIAMVIHVVANPNPGPAISVMIVKRKTAPAAALSALPVMVADADIA
jgi:hypothetical protein